MTTAFHVPVTSHPDLPEGVPLVADFNDDRSRLSYYYPILQEIDGVRTPITRFFGVEGSYQTYPDVAYREITRFMQDQSLRNAFVRGDYSSGKFDGDAGSKLTSHDPYDIEGVVLEMLRQLGRSKRHLGGRIAVREWIPHDAEVRYFIRDGEVLYGDSAGAFDGDGPVGQARLAARGFTTFAWSCDFIRHATTGKWYCIDMGLDGLYKAETEWVPISEHLKEMHSPKQYADAMPRVEVLKP